MMEDPVVIVAVEDEAVVGLPAIGVDGRSGQDFPLNNGHQLFFRAIRNDCYKTFPFLFNSPNTGVLPAAPRPLLPRTRRAPK